MTTAFTRARAGWVPLVVSISLLLAAPLRAQEVATSFEELRRLVKPGDTIYVTETGGATIKGRLAGLSAASLDLSVQRDALAPPLRLSGRDINNIVLERRDSLWNGTLIGLAVGAVPVALIALFEGRSEYGAAVPRDAPRYEEPFNAGPIVSSGGIGLVTGLLIDVFNKERITIYVHAQAVGAAAGALDDTATGNDPILLAPSRGRVSPASTASSFTELRVLVKPGQTVSVTDASGRQIGGRIVELSPAAVAVMVQGARLDFAESEVTQIERLGDPLWNGAVIGLGVGAGVGFVAGAIGVREDPRGFPSDVLGAIARGAILLAGVTIGTATGVVIDALHKQRKVVYLTPKSREEQGETRGGGPPAGALIISRAVSKQRTGVSVAPLLGKDRQGVLVSVSF